MLPDFLIVGAPKAGTTALYRYLKKHPQVFMSEPKELNFFSKDELDDQNLFYRDLRVKNIQDYKQYFDAAAPSQIIGEASVSYLFYPNVPQKIKNLLPNVKIIAILRNPFLRGFSHYLMDYRLGLVSVSYDEIVFKTANHPLLDIYYQQYVSLGLYYDQIKMYFDVFGRGKVCVFLSDSFLKNPSSVADQVCDFLGIRRIGWSNSSVEDNRYFMPRGRIARWLYADPRMRIFASKVFPNFMKLKIKEIFFAKEKKPKMTSEAFNQLRKVYYQDIAKLSQLIEVDLSSWLEAQP